MVLLCFSSCSRTKTGEINGKEYSITPVDSTNNNVIETADFTGVIFGYDIGKLSEEKDLFNPVPEEIFKAEKVFNRCLYVDRVGADSMAIVPEMIQELTVYYRQYQGYIDEKGQKHISISFFTKSSAGRRDWRKTKLAVRDGGNSFFRVTINIDTEECSYFMVNGKA